MLPVLARSLVSVTELVTMFLIEASGEEIVYRSRGCSQLIPSLFRTGKCDSCIGLLENIKNLEPMLEPSEKIKVVTEDSTYEDFETTFENDETGHNISISCNTPQVISFKKKLAVKAERRKQSSRVVKSFDAHSNIELDPSDLKTEKSIKFETDTEKAILEEEYLAIEHQEYENSDGNRESQSVKYKRSMTAGSKKKKFTGTRKCPFCTEMFRVGTVKFLKHVKLFHASESETEAYINFFQDNAPSICPSCGLEFNNESGLQYHIGVCNGSKICRCHICGKTIIAHHSSSMERHLSRHKIEENQVCPHCGKVYNNRQRLTDHLKKSCEAEKSSYKCPSCEKVFDTYFSRDLHVRRVHKKEKPLACEQCGKRFFSARALREHIISMHDKIKPYVCDLCGFKTAKIDNLNLHRKKMHGSSYLGQRAFWDMIQNGDHPYIDQSYEYLHLLKPKKELINQQS